MTPVKKVCVITGGTSGIGLCTAQAMLEKGYTVYELSLIHISEPTRPY